MPSVNLELLKVTARLLKPVLNELVFVGGCTTGLLITDQGAAEVRSTFDVDAIAEITSYAGYATFGEQLRSLGFSEDGSEGAPICRWRHGEIKLDLMPLDEEILGFSNRWYQEAMASATEYHLAEELTIRVVSPVYFCATKLEAFKGRGGGDYLSSHDLEDLITVVDGRPELYQELKSAPEGVRSYIASAFNSFLESVEFKGALPGHLLPDPASQGRLGIMVERLTQISRLGDTGERRSDS
jgi:predicted nucleotidyltransferase